MLTFRAIGVSTTPAAGGTFTATVQFIQMDEGPPATSKELSVQNFVVTDRAALEVLCQAELDRLKRSWADAQRALDISGKTIAQVTTS